jgi:hypothetical protein
MIGDQKVVGSALPLIEIGTRFLPGQSSVGPERQVNTGVKLSPNRPWRSVFPVRYGHHLHIKR